MLSIDHGFSTSVKRSGHAACWCAALGGIVQFGGWPPSEQLSEVYRHEGSSCPLYYMPVTTIARHLHRADQRRHVDSLEVALAHHRQHRLRELLTLASDSAQDKDNAKAEGEERNHEDLKEAPSPRFSGVVLSAAAAQRLRSPSHSSLSVTTEEASERGFVYDEGYVSDVAESDGAAASSNSSGSDDEDSSSNSNGNGSGADENNQTDAAAASPAASPVSATATEPSPLLESSSAGPSSPTGVVAPVITVELLRQVVEETEDRLINDGEASPVVAGHTTATISHDGRTSASRSTTHHTGRATSTLRGFGKGGAHPAVEREAPPLQRDTHEVLGKYTVRPLRWLQLRPVVAPRTRHGHHLVSCGERLYVLGGSYWAHGNALASTDMMYDVRKKVWQQVSSLFPPRFCAALARSNTVPREKWMPASWSSAGGPSPTSDTATAAPVDLSQLQGEQVLYYFGGLNYSRQLTNTLYRLWLPQETLEELPQYGALPREQFKGLLVCDVQRECNPAERKRGERALGRLFYLDGLQDGRPMAPYLRVYNLANGVWVRVCPSPDLVRSQVSLAQYEPISEPSTSKSAGEPNSVREAATANLVEVPTYTTTRLRRFEVVGGMPSRRGKQRRSRMCYAFDALQQRFDYSNALPVPGLTAHCTVALPAEEEERDSLEMESTTAATADVGAAAMLLADGVTTPAAYRAAVSLLREQYGVWSICCGGNEDWNDAEQNSLGVPVGWLYLFTPRAIPLSEVARVQMECLRIPAAVLGAEKDELLDELF